MRVRLRKRLGDLLVEEGIITSQQLDQALTEQRTTEQKLGDILISMGHIDESILLDFVSRQLDIRHVDLNKITVDSATVNLLSEIRARRLRALVIGHKGDTVEVAMSDPADLASQEVLFNLLKDYQINLAIVSERQLVSAFDRYYRRTQDIASFAVQLKDEHKTEDQLSFGGDDNDIEEKTVVKMINSVFEDAILVGASDIHIEPDEHVLRIRQRVDGILHENIINEKSIAPALVLRLKLISGLNISEKRLPQDGRFNIKVRNRSVDVRISTLPVQYGESVVMRLLDQSAGVKTMDQVGMPDHILQRFLRHLKRPHGMILVTGPTGSGKTTTLYGALNELNIPGKKLITAEDPVEFRLPRINQVQVNSKIGLTFSTVLRTFLRQDPDVILIGEMRDQETVEIGLRAALTGHLVLSTLHTNNAVDSALRMMDMGAPGYLVASAVRAVVAQRLVRRICSDCAEEQPLDPEQKAWLKMQFPQYEHHTFRHGKGCQTCNSTGYRGRIGVFELMEMRQNMIDALCKSDTVLFSQLARQSEGYKPLVVTAMELALDGITSLDEVVLLGEGELSNDL